MVNANLVIHQVSQMQRRRFVYVRLSTENHYQVNLSFVNYAENSHMCQMMKHNVYLINVPNNSSFNKMEHAMTVEGARNNISGKIALKILVQIIKNFLLMDHVQIVV